jgi:hypothetical protein
VGEKEGERGRYDEKERRDVPLPPINGERLRVGAVCQRDALVVGSPLFYFTDPAPSRAERRSLVDAGAGLRKLKGNRAQK